MFLHNEYSGKLSLRNTNHIMHPGIDTDNDISVREARVFTTYQTVDHDGIDLICCDGLKIRMNKVHLEGIISVGSLKGC